MTHPLTSRKRAHIISIGLFFLFLIGLIITGNWWPGIMIAIGLPLAIQQYLLGRTYDAMISILVFIGTFVTVQFDISWKIFLPILFSLGAIYILYREFFIEEETTESEREEDSNKEFEEKKKK